MDRTSDLIGLLLYEVKLEPVQRRVDVDFSTLHLKKAYLVRRNALKEFHVKVDFHCRVNVTSVTHVYLSGSTCK